MTTRWTFLLLVLAFSAHGAVFVSSERFVSDASAPTVDSAIGNGEAMVCWTEPDSKIHVARVSATGERIGNTMVVAPHGAYQDHPRIAFDGVHYLVVWTEIPSEPAGSGTLSARLLNLDGSPASDVTVLSDSIMLFQFGAPITGTFAPSLSWDGTRYLVIWEKRDLTVAAVSVTADARIEREVLVPVRSGTSTRVSTFSAATDAAGDTLLMWEWTSDDRTLAGIDAALLDGNLVMQKTITLDSASYSLYGQMGSALVPQQPSVASNGAAFYVVWTRYAGRPAGSEIRGARVDANARVDPTSVVTIDTTGGTDFDLDGRIAWDGEVFVIAWKRISGGPSAGIRGARISSTGALLDVFAIAPGPQISTLPGAVTLAPLLPGHTAVVYVSPRVAVRIIDGDATPRRRAIKFR